MPDDYHPPMPRRNPEDIDLGAIKADLEFLIERVTRFRREQALKPLYTMVGSAAIVIALPQYKITFGDSWPLRVRLDNHGYRRIRRVNAQFLMLFNRPSHIRH
jgi:hypothetical protein